MAVLEDQFGNKELVELAIDLRTQKVYRAINITGGSGSGCSTLGRALAEAFQLSFLDSDNFYWLPSVPPYRLKNDPDKRDPLIIRAMAMEARGFVLAGSVDSWGWKVSDRLDAVIFLTLSKQTRMKRLIAREVERFGQSDPDFLAWASQYDEGALDGRSRPRHEKWLGTLNCPVFRVENSGTIDETLNQIISALR